MDIISETKKPSFKDEVKQRSMDWILASTLHGLPSVFRVKEIFLKIMWLCCFIASFSYCTYSVAKSFIAFFQYPSTISTSIIQPIPTQFPGVTICNMKPVNYTAAKIYISDLYFWPNGTYKFAPNVEEPFDYVILQNYLYKFLLNSNSNLQTVQREIGYELSDMLISCRFSYQKCTADDFYYFNHPFYGNCYTFNKGIIANGSDVGIQNVSVAGPDYGLILELFIGNPVKETLFQFSDGIVVQIHNQSFIPQLTRDRIRVPVGTETDISIKRTFEKALDQPYGDCLVDTSSQSKFSSLYFDFIVRKKGVTYSQEYCFDLCLQNKIIELCGCANIFLPLFGDSVSCATLESLDCSTGVMYEFAKYSDSCKTGCPRECEVVKYEVTTTNSLYPTYFYKDLLANNSKLKNSGVPYDLVESSVLKLNVFYQSINYLYTEQQVSQTEEQFVSNLGGTLGLCLGMSFLSIVEIFEITITLAYMYKEYRKNAKKIVNPTITMSMGSFGFSESPTNKQNNSVGMGTTEEMEKQILA